MPEKMWQSTYPRNFGNLVTVRSPVRPQQRYTNVKKNSKMNYFIYTSHHQSKITQSTRMVTQMQLEVILAKNRIATRVL